MPPCPTHHLTENIFNKIIRKKFTKLGKKMPTKVQKAYRISNRQDQKTTCSSQNIQCSKQRKHIQSCKTETKQHYDARHACEGSSWLLNRYSKARRAWADVLQVWMTTDASRHFSLLTRRERRACKDKRQFQGIYDHQASLTKETLKEYLGLKKEFGTFKKQ